MCNILFSGFLRDFSFGLQQFDHDVARYDLLCVYCFGSLMSFLDLVNNVFLKLNKNLTIISSNFFCALFSQSSSGAPIYMYVRPSDIVP